MSIVHAAIEVVNLSDLASCADDRHQATTTNIISGGFVDIEAG